MKTANMSFAVMALMYSASAREVQQMAREVQQMSELESTSSPATQGWCDMSTVQKHAWVKSQWVALRAKFSKLRADMIKQVKGAIAQYREARGEIITGFKANRMKIITAFRAAIKGKTRAERKVAITAVRKELTDQRNAVIAQLNTLRDRFMASRKSFIDTYRKQVKTTREETRAQVKSFKKTAAECEAESSTEEEPETETETVTEPETESEKTESEKTATASEESEATESEESEDGNCVAPKVFGDTCDRAILRALHEQKACLWKNNGSKTTKYVDVGFPADKSSANAGAWKRPSEMTTNPSLWGSKGVRPAAVQQGGLGDCWWLSTAAALAEEDDGARVKAVITNKNEATGIYEFKFFRNGNFEKVVIDDRLPVSRSSSRDSMYARKSPNGAWWVPLMEKAAAKFYGRYSNLVGGNMKQGWEMLTGMPSRSYTPSSVSDLKTLLDDADTAGHVINCNVSGRGCVNGRKNGLPCGHAYTLLEHTKWRNGDYVKIRNPWGSTEWNGALSDSDTSATAKSFFNDNAHPQANDGTFWMSTDDFKGNFYEVVVGDYIPTWKHSSKPVEWKRTSSTVAWNFGFTNPVAQAVSIGLLGNQDRVFMDDKCEHEDRIGYGYRVQRDQHFFKIQNSRGANQTGKDGKWYKIFSGLVADSYLRYDNLAAGTYAIKGVTDQAANKGRAGTLHFAANAWAQKQAIVFN